VLGISSTDHLSFFSLSFRNTALAPAAVSETATGTMSLVKDVGLKAGGNVRSGRSFNARHLSGRLSCVDWRHWNSGTDGYLAISPLPGAEIML
jgi:hypothetical protein